MNPELNTLRQRYSDEALTYIPRLFLMIDRNQYSPTYGCFDRSYWHYRTMDFPCGMSQEFVLPLALAYSYPFPNNPYYHVERVKELALAGIRYAMQSSHKNGTCDDYFPNERALGALVFSLNAFCESLSVLNEKPDDLLEFVHRRASYLKSHNESGKLTNHQALAALALHGAYDLTGDTSLLDASKHFVSIVQSWQSSEGWFQEYEGADPGYHSCTISFLARLFKKNHDTSLLDILNPAVDFAWYFMHPDGSYAGEYGSRNTYHFYPYGFEIMAPYNEKAAQIADHFLQQSIPHRTRYYNDDDRMCAHYLYDWLQSYIDFSETRSSSSILKTPSYHKWFEQAKIFVNHTDTYHAVANLSKGGVIKVFGKDGPIYSDTGVIAKQTDGKVIVSHLIHENNRVSFDENTKRLVVFGQLDVRGAKYSSPTRQILFRVLNISMGLFNENLLRKFLQKVLITGKKKTSVEFKRELTFRDDDIEIVTEFHSDKVQTKLLSAHIASDATSIYVANSNVFQQSVLLPWISLDKFCMTFNEKGQACVRVNIKPGDISVKES